MIKTLQFVCLLFFSISYAQTINALYKVNFRPSLQDSKIETNYMMLEINTEESYFYPSKLNEKQTEHYLNFIVKQKAQNYSYFGSLNDLNFQYDESYNQNWKLQKDTLTLEKYKCQSATTQFEGRRWKVYFTREVPLNFGPYKFHGLPGLIVKATSEDGEYEFELVSLEKISQSSFKFTKTYKKLEKDFVEKYITDFIKDPAGNNIKMVNSYGDSFNYVFEGKNSKSYKETSSYLSKAISKYNNPIDKKTIILLLD